MKFSEIFKSRTTRSFELRLNNVAEYPTKGPSKIETLSPILIGFSGSS